MHTAFDDSSQPARSAQRTRILLRVQVQSVGVVCQPSFFYGVSSEIIYLGDDGAADGEDAALVRDVLYFQD